MDDSLVVDRGRDAQWWPVYLIHFDWDTSPSERMGANLPSPRPYAGAIDDVMIFERVLNVIEIQALARL